jgi:uncharacterized protein YpmS
MMKRISFFLLVLVLSSLACGLPTSSIAPTITPAPVDPAQADALEDQLATAVADLVAGNPVTITITEAQLAAYIDRRISDEPDAPISQPQVTLRDGKIEVTGQVTLDKLTAQANLVFEVFVENGRLQVRLIDAKLGALPIPERILNQINDTMNNNMEQMTTVENRRIEVQSVSIADGVMTIVGQMVQP